MANPFSCILIQIIATPYHPTQSHHISGVKAFPLIVVCGKLGSSPSTEQLSTENFSKSSGRDWRCNLQNLAKYQVITNDAPNASGELWSFANALKKNPPSRWLLCFKWDGGWGNSSAVVIAVLVQMLLREFWYIFCYLLWEKAHSQDDYSVWQGKNWALFSNRGNGTLEALQHKIQTTSRSSLLNCCVAWMQWTVVTYILFLQLLCLSIILHLFQKALCNNIISRATYLYRLYRQSVTLYYKLSF